MADKPSLEDCIAKWIEVDNEVESLKSRLKTMKTWKQKLTHAITKYMENQDLVDHTLEIRDGTIRYHERKEYSAVTFSYIEKCLKELITDDEHVQYVVEYLKEKREIKYVPELKRRKYSTDDGSEKEEEETES